MINPLSITELDGTNSIYISFTYKLFLINVDNHYEADIWLKLHYLSHLIDAFTIQTKSISLIWSISIVIFNTFLYTMFIAIKATQISPEIEGLMHMNTNLDWLTWEFSFFCHVLSNLSITDTFFFLNQHSCINFLEVFCFMPHYNKYIDNR